MSDSRAMAAVYSQYSTVVKFEELPDPDDSWELVERVGEGTYGEVHLATNKHSGRSSNDIGKNDVDMLGRRCG